MDTSDVICTTLAIIYPGYFGIISGWWIFYSVYSCVPIPWAAKTPNAEPKLDSLVFYHVHH